MTEAITRSARAKINLFLRVFAPDTGGYHPLETLFARIELADTVTGRRTESSGLDLEVIGADLGPPEENLVWRAAESVLASLRTRFGVALRLEKHIPVGAGLGGGSADAAATLLLVNELAGNAVPRAELFQMAARLGADVSFCLSEAPLALAWGHGERMMRLPALPPAPILLLSPSVPVSTAEAYRWIDQSRTQPVRRGAVLLDAASLAGWRDVARMAGNDFESVVFAHRPEIRSAFEALARTGPLLCRMTGSGSTLFAVYRSERECEDARLTLGRKHGAAVATRTSAGA
jgi:4-diphosphocytidyl-2-C-methyl-D-erythritol kinase